MASMGWVVLQAHVANLAGCQSTGHSMHLQLPQTLKDGLRVWTPPVLSIDPVSYFWWEKEESTDGSRVPCVGELLKVFRLWDHIRPGSRWFLKVGNGAVRRCRARNGSFDTS